MEWPHVDFENGWITLLRTKNRERRPVPFEVSMPRQPRALLWEMAGEKGYPVEGHVFANGRGKPYTTGQVYVPLKRLVRRLWIQSFTPKLLRKVVATEVRERSDDVRLAQVQLGHSRIATTERYIQRDRKAKVKAAHVIEQLAAEVDGDFAGDLSGDTHALAEESGTKTQSVV